MIKKFYFLIVFLIFFFSLFFYFRSNVIAYCYSVSSCSGGSAVGCSAGEMCYAACNRLCCPPGGSCYTVPCSATSQCNGILQAGNIYTYVCCGTTTITTTTTSCPLPACGNKICGSVSNSCGTRNCGTCTSPLICTANQLHCYRTCGGYCSPTRSCIYVGTWTSSYADCSDTWARPPDTINCSCNYNASDSNCSSCPGATTTTSPGTSYHCMSNCTCQLFNDTNGFTNAGDCNYWCPILAGCTTTTTSAGTTTTTTRPATTTTTSAGAVVCPSSSCPGGNEYGCYSSCPVGWNISAYENYVPVGSACGSSTCCYRSCPAVTTTTAPPTTTTAPPLTTTTTIAATTTTAAPTYTISGQVYIDTNENGFKEVSEEPYPGATVSVGGGKFTTNVTGNYSASGILAGSYLVALTIPNGYEMSTGDPVNPKSVVIGPNSTANFGIILTPVTYTTTGYIFVDDNIDGVKDPAEDCYSGSLSVRFTPDGGGSETIESFTSSSNPICDTFSLARNDECGVITITGLSNGYEVVALNYTDNTHPSSTVSYSNSIYVCGSEVNFGVSNSSSWIQTKDADIRIDSGFDDPIPADASCGTSIGSYASLTGEGGTPGIVFSGDSSYSFGQGQASVDPFNWVVGGTIYPEVYNPSVSRKTSTAYLLSKAAQLGITPIDIAASCRGAGGIASCNLAPGLAAGIYVANGDLTLTSPSNSYTFPANNNYIVIVKGDLNIDEEISVNNGSTAIFSAHNINVGQTVGESDPTSTDSTIEGWFSADTDFTINGINDCGVQDDLRLNIGGNVVVGAAGGNGSFQNNRTLCAANTSCPSLYIEARPDFVLNAPSIIKTSSYTWQEVAP